MRSSLIVQLSTAFERSLGAPLLDEIFGPSRTDPATAIVDLVGHIAHPTELRQVYLGSGIVVGFTLQDGQSVAVKVHRRHIVERLDAVLAAQRAMRGSGIPVPIPLVDSPISVGTGAATIDSWLDDGGTVDVRPPHRRRAIAQCAATISAALRDVEPFAPLAPSWTGRYPPPHSPVFDFVATGAGAQWIDELADAALATRTQLLARGTGRLVVGHADLRPENLLFDDEGVSSVYDLDSLSLDVEPWLIGGVARAFSTNWSLDDPMLPTVPEIDHFVNDYEQIRGAPFAADERSLCRSAIVHSLAYSARCEHSLYPDGRDAPWGPGWRHLLRAYAASLAT